MGFGHARGQEGSDRRLERGATLFIQEAVQRARYWRDHKAIKPERMGADFGSEVVKRDAELVRTRTAEFARTDTQEKKEEAMISEVFEVSLWWLAQNKAFFGEQTKAILPSRYDDFVNGTDLILEITSETAAEVSRLGIGIDATFGAEAVENKLDRLGADVSAGKSGEIKYYVSSDGKERRNLSSVPHLIIGLSVARAREMAQLWRRVENKESTTYSPDAHPLRVLVLQQLIAQASALAVLARANGNEELANQYQTAYNKLRPIHEKAMSAYLRAATAAKEKPWKDILDQDYRKDPVHEAILKRAEGWKKAATSH